VPYVVGGVNLGMSQLNDRKSPGVGSSIRNKEATLLLGTVGGGIEHFFVDNIAVGVEVKYIAAGDQTITINGVSRDQEVASVLTMLSLRLVVPERCPVPLVEARGSIPVRLYLGGRVGTAFTTSDGFEPFIVRAEPPAYGGAGNQLIGAALGLNVGRHWGVELAADAYEVRIDDPGFGSLGEMAVHTIVPHLRVRYPLGNGPAVPYLIGGVGLGWAEFNDRKAPRKDLEIEGESVGLAAAVGAGVEYVVASNIAMGVEARYVTSRGHTFEVRPGPSTTAASTL